MNLMSFFGGAGVSDAAVRVEVWNLGVRHHGKALEGALAELKAPDLPAGRERLLRACVRKLKAA